MKDQLIAGSGGGGGRGGKGGGGGGGSANVTKDNLDSKQVARIIDLLGEGEIEGFPSARNYTLGTTQYNVAMLKDIYLDNTPILRDGADPANVQSSDYNFDITNAVFEFRTGTQNQTYTQNVGDANQSTHSVGIKATFSSPVTRSITDPNVNAVRVTIGTPALQIFKNNGDVEGATIQYRIQVSYNGGPYTTVVDSSITGRTADLYQRVHRIDLTAAPPVNIRVVRVNADAPVSGTTTENSDLYWYDYTEKINAKTTYPNSALFAVKLNAEQFSSIPSRAYRVRGLKVRVPNNATVDANNGRLTYSGTWNGTFSSAKWTSDPAWILWDLLTSKRYGFGDHIAEADLDKWSFYAASQYCGQLVSNGKGGQEPRFSCNVILQTQEEAFKLINDLCSVFRAMPYWSAGSLQISQDAPQDYAYIFNQTNVTEAGFNYSGSSLKTRHTVAVVQYFDMNLRDVAYEVVEDKEGIDKFGVVKVEIAAFACTSQAQARRVGEWLLYTEQNETEIVSFSTDIAAGITVRPGDLIKIGDPVRAGVMRSGRCSTGSTTTVVKLDRTATDLFPSGAPANFTLNVLLPDGTLGINPGSTISGNQITVGTALALAPTVGAPWTIGNTQVAMSTWRVLGIKEEGDVYSVTAVAYNSTKYDYIERNVPLNTRDVSDLNEPPDSPTNLNVKELLYESNGQVLAKLIVGWRPADRALTYEVRYRFNNGNWTSTTTRSVDIEIQNSDVGLYEIQITAVGAINSKRSSPSSLTYNAIGKTAPPATIPDLFIAPIDDKSAELYWPQAEDIDVRLGGEIRIRHCPLSDNTASWGKANDIVPAVPGSATRKIVPLLTGTYFIRAVDSTGNESIGVTSTVVTLPAPQDALLIQEYHEESSSPPYAGNAANMIYNTVEAGLVLAASTLVDSMATDGDWDAISAIDYVGGSVTEGSYQYANALDLGAVYDINLRGILKTRAFEPGNYIDDRLAYMDDWDALDGDDLGAVNSSLYVRSTNDNPFGTPTWGMWQPFVNNTARGRGFQFKLQVDATNSSQNVVVEQLGVRTELERRTELQRNITSGASTYTVTYPSAFYDVPSVGITAQDLGTGGYFTVSNATRTGFQVTFRNSGGSIVSKVFDYQAVGHGRQIA